MEKLPLLLHGSCILVEMLVHSCICRLMLCCLVIATTVRRLCRVAVALLQARTL